jgi:hypothetical protein
MSIYSCSDAIKKALRQQGVEQSYTGVMQYLKTILPTPFHQITANENHFLQEVREELNAIGDGGYKASKESRLGILIEKIKSYSEDHDNSPLNPLLDDIVKDLLIVKNGRTAPSSTQDTTASSRPKATQSEPSPELKQYKALLESRLRIANLTQGAMNDLGNSNGECYGFTMSMADSDLSPYKNREIKQVEFNKAIHKYQKNQSNREKDEKYIKRSRMTTKTFCPSLQERAERLYEIASEHKGEDLYVELQSKTGLHATYLSVQDDNKIRFADPNHGVFLFDNKEQFISAYRLIYHVQNQQSHSSGYNYFSVSQLKEDKKHELSGSNTLAGKWRSFMDGRKYEPEESLIPDAGKIMLSAGGGIAGAVAGAALGSVIPVIGTVIGGIIGAVAGFTAGVGASDFLQKKGHTGFFGPFHYLREKLYDMSETVKTKLGFKRECDEAPEMVLPESGSTADMIQKLCPDGVSQKQDSQKHEEVMSSVHENTPVPQITAEQNPVELVSDSLSSDEESHQTNALRFL